MKAFLATCLIVTAPHVWAVETTPPRFDHAPATASIRNAAVVTNLERRPLKKTPPAVLFGTVGGPERIAADARLMDRAHAIPASMTLTGDIHIPRAIGSNALTVAEIIANGAELKDQTVTVRGKVVRYNADILGRNWVHLRDGTGSTVDNTNDLLVTTEDEAKIGDVVTARGVVRTDMDFGSGYSYKVLIEEATLQEQQSAAR